MYTLNYYIYRGDDFNVSTELRTHGCAAPVDHAALADLRWPAADACERLFLYRQLIGEFGWDPMQRVFHSYYDPAYPRSTYGGALDGFAIRFSAVVQRDLADFLRHWDYPLSSSGEATIRGFGFEKWLPPGWQRTAISSRYDKGEHHEDNYPSAGAVSDLRAKRPGPVMAAWTSSTI